MLNETDNNKSPGSQTNYPQYFAFTLHVDPIDMKLLTKFEIFLKSPHKKKLKFFFSLSLSLKSKKKLLASFLTGNIELDCFSF
jgi:hypothetical protein